MVSDWKMSNDKSPQVSSILADFNNAVVWIVPVCPPISKTSCSHSIPLGTVPSSPITIGNTVTLMLINIRSDLLAVVRCSVCISKFRRMFDVFKTDSCLCIYYLTVWLNFNSFQWITFPTESCLVSYPLCVSLKHSLYYVMNHFVSITT